MKVVFLQCAEEDLRELRAYILDNFGARAWAKSYSAIKETMRSLQQFPHLGSIPVELTDLDIDRFRQVLAGESRIVYELGEEMVFVHIVCDSRRDMKSLLIRRLCAIRKSD